MNKIFRAAFLIYCAFAVMVTYAESSGQHNDHIHETLVDGEKLEADPELFGKFVEGLTKSQIAIVSVKGMVCDFFEMKGRNHFDIIFDLDDFSTPIGRSLFGMILEETL